MAIPSLAVSMACFFIFTFLILFSNTSKKLYFLILAQVFFFAALNLLIFSFFLGSQVLIEISSFLYIYRDGFKLGLLLFFRMLAGFSCLYFLISTTPSTQLFNALKKIGTPDVFIEVMALIYQYIFLIFKDTSKMFIALKSRTASTLGFKKLGRLLANVFIRSFNRQEMMWISMTSRCYDGRYPALKIKHVKINELIPVVLFDLVLIIIGVLI
ncbi:MAG: cobalt ECF transporter T component CbiQ [Methanocellales archaeon]